MSTDVGTVGRLQTKLVKEHYVISHVAIEVFLNNKHISQIGEKIVKLSETAADYLRNLIMNGELKDREKIVEKDVADQLGMSRGPIREALMQLQYEGFVDYEANRGCTVTLLSPRDAYEVFYMRGSLEKIALERCGGHIMKDSILMMEEILEDMKHYSDGDEINKRLIECDELFHRQIILSGQMNRLTALWESISPLNAAMFVTVKNMKKRERILYERLGRPLREDKNTYEMHKILFDVLKEGNLENSTEILTEHYQRTGERILKIAMRSEQTSIFG